jgi:hypothetical protein
MHRIPRIPLALTAVTLLVVACTGVLLLRPTAAGHPASAPTICASTGVVTSSADAPAGAVSDSAHVLQRRPPLSSHVVFGVAMPDLPYGRHDLPRLESELGGPLGAASAFVDWSYLIGGPNETWMSARGSRKVLLAWEPSNIRFADVVAHSQDPYLGAVAVSMRAFPYDVYVRPWPEMNASWSTWQPTADGSKRDGGTPDQFVAAWRYLVTFMRSRGVKNLKFVFNPDADGGPGATPVEAIWPGCAYVDVLGIDGYNWGNTIGPAGGTWRSFESIFGRMYGTLTALDGGAPVWITEFGSKEPRKEDDWHYPASSSPVDSAHNKATWIDEMMASTSFPRVSALVYFNKRKERDWRLESSPEALSAIRRYI